MPVHDAANAGPRMMRAGAHPPTTSATHSAQPLPNHAFRCRSAPQHRVCFFGFGGEHPTIQLCMLPTVQPLRSPALHIERGPPLHTAAGRCQGELLSRACSQPERSPP
jgi:hypothetical protein